MDGRHVKVGMVAKGRVNKMNPKLGSNLKVACVFIPSIVGRCGADGVSLTWTAIVSPTFDVVSLPFKQGKATRLFALTVQPRHEVRSVWLSGRAVRISRSGACRTRLRITPPRMVVVVVAKIFKLSFLMDLTRACRCRMCETQS